MNTYFPHLELAFESLQEQLLFVPYVIVVFGFMLKVNQTHIHRSSIYAPILKLALIVIAIAYTRDLFHNMERFFLRLAEHIDSGYVKSPLEVIAQLVSGNEKKNPSFLTNLLGEGVYQSLSLAIGQLFIKFVSLLQIPILIIQYFIIKLGLLIAPTMVAVFMFPSLSVMATHFMTHMASVMAWPIGFAITSLSAKNILKGFDEGFPGSSANDSMMENLGLSLTAALIMLVGTWMTPKMLHVLFSAGHGLGMLPTEVGRLGSTVASGFSQGSSTVIEKLKGGLVMHQNRQSRTSSHNNTRGPFSQHTYRNNQQPRSHKIPRGATSDV